MQRAVWRSSVMRMDLQDGETILFQGHPSWRAALLFFTQGFLASAAVGAIIWLIAGMWSGIIVALVLAGLTVLVGIVVRSATEYVITDERLHIRRGLLSRKIQETRLSRVQDVTVSQSLWERMVGIGRADFDTAAADSANDFVFAGIERPDRVRAAVDSAHRMAEQRSVPPSAPGL